MKCRTLFKVGMLLSIGMFCLTPLVARELESVKRKPTKIAPRSTTQETPAKSPTEAECGGGPEKTDAACPEMKAPSEKKRGAKDPAKAKAHLMGRFDTNKDGSLDSTEIDEMLKQRAQRQGDKATRLAKLDTNHDGTIDDTERKVAKQGRRKKTEIKE